MELENAVVLVGLIVGAAALGTACAVWYRKQEFGIGGATLSVVGVILIGLSIWSGVTFSITADGLQVELDSLEERLAQVAENSSVVSEEVVKLNDVVTRSRGQAQSSDRPTDGGVAVPDRDRTGVGTGVRTGTARTSEGERPTLEPTSGQVDAARLKRSSQELRALSKIPTSKTPTSKVPTAKSGAQASAG